MFSRKYSFFLTVVALCSGLFSTLSAIKPNIIIFYVDDLGWQDVEQLNDLGEPCPYETPNLLKLAERGMNFSQGYASAPTCAPSRAAILSGQHPAQTRYTHVTGASIPKQGKDNEFQEAFLGAYFDLDHMTLADALKQNGYRTGHYGKWHAGLNASAYGFESVNQTRGVHRGMKDRTKDFSTPKDRQWPLSKEKYPPYSEDFPDGISYPYDELTEEALEFIQDNKEEAFFLNLCHWMVHWPMLTRNGELLKYYCKKMGQPFPPKKGNMALPGQQNPYFASMVTTVDWSLGLVMDMLATTDDPRYPGKKLIETTYVFFTSDNGGAEKKGGEILSDNYPLKGGKKRTDEGGVRVPLVIAGPNIPAGTERATMINQLDFFPTILRLTSTDIPAENAAKLSGLDITPVLTGEASEVYDAEGHPRDSLFWHFPHNSMRAAIRKGDYKLYCHFNTGEYSLYRLYKNGAHADLEEQEDLSRNPEYASIVDALSQELNQKLESSNAELPHRNPNYRNATLPSASIVNLNFNPAGTQANLQLDPDQPKATEAYILYYPDGGKGEGHGKKTIDYNQVGDPEIPYRVKVAASIDASGHVVTATVPPVVKRVQFMLIDENNYCHFTQLASVP
ncbi:sulfatase [Coraliomargarita sp. SDUM461003]|uniref:Sulfatase n=1 Tax=Thalassobacterium maritimum TaxID=3041265 RepID=A0ABU1B0L8_9BACT|nr:sulfatase [Coraliomargarita sp. SDUM461003]MDQ8209462.1 sulfatase [Coraliomargarita sp. SDUM461003]